MRTPTSQKEALNRDGSPNMESKYDSVMQRICYRYVPGHEPVTENGLQSLEANIGLALPDDYRTFLLKYGMSAGEGDTRFRNLDESEQIESSVDVFYGLKPGHTYDLLEKYRMFRNRLPAHVLPFASGSGGHFCLSLTGEDAGRIYWWDPHGDNEAPYENLELVAYDFDSFINSLTICEE